MAKRNKTPQFTGPTAEKRAAKEEQERALVKFQYRVSDARNQLERELREEAIKLFGPTVGNDIIL